MGIEPTKRAFDLSKVSDKVLHVDNENATLTIRDQVVIVSSDTAVATITLPSVAEAAGLIFDISAPDGDDNTVTVADKGDDAAYSDVSLDAANEYIVLWSNGVQWRELITGYS